MMAPRLVCARRQGGMALLVVLWVVVLLSVIAAAHSSNVHATTRMTTRQLELAQLQATADSGVQRAILELLAEGSPDPWPVNGNVQTIEVMDRPVSIAIRAAGGLLDLNSAAPQLLSALVDATSAEPEQKAALVDAILDWRDADDLTRLHGAEDDDYPSQNGWTMRNGAFLAVDELRYVLGMTNQIYQEMAPLLTVYSGNAGVNLEYAPPALLRALTGEQVQAADEVLPATSSTPSRSGSRAGTFHVYVEASSATASAALEAVVRIKPADEQPVTVLHWREPGRALPGAAR